ncbi:hypothetical protein QFZ21_001304 [Microbacterium sp. W4I20]|nr:hypothetical protein [Microbacterium sp. W4I20]
MWFGIALIIIVVANLIKLLSRSREMPVAILVFAILVAEVVQISVSGDLNARTFWFLMALGFFLGVRAVIPGSMPVAPEAVPVAPGGHPVEGSAPPRPPGGLRPTARLRRS